MIHGLNLGAIGLKGVGIIIFLKNTADSCRVGNFYTLLILRFFPCNIDCDPLSQSSVNDTVEADMEHEEHSD